MTSALGFGRRSTFILVVVIVAVSAFAATAYVLWRMRAETIERHLETAAMTVRAFEDHLTQSFNVIDRTLVNVASNAGETPALPEGLSVIDRTHAGVTPALRELAAALRQAPYLRAIAVLGEADRIVASSEPRNVSMRLLRDDFLPRTAEPVEVLRVGPLRAGRDFYDARPLSAANPNPTVSFMPVARDVRLDDARWMTVAASVNADYFLNFYANHITPAEGTVQLLRYDGRLLLSTDAGEIPGSRDGGVTARIAATEVGHFEETLANGRAMLTAYRSSRAFPFVLVVRLDKEFGLADWRQEAANTFGIVGAILLAALALASGYFVRFERVARERDRDQDRLRIAAIAFESQEGMVVTDAHAVVLQVNQAFTRITGYAAAEVIGQSMSFLKSGLHDAAFYAAIREQVGRSGAWAGEIRNRHKDGSIHPHSLMVTAVLDNAGRVSHYVGTLTDISARKLAEESLLTLSRAVEQSPVSIVITDTAGHIQYGNPKFEESTGYPLAEVIGKNPRLLSSGEKSREDYQTLWSTLTAGNTWHGEFHNRRKDGTLYWELASISPVFNDAGELLHFVGVKEDITARKLTEEKIGELNRDFVSFLENTSDFIYFKDKDSRFRFCSQTLANITGHASWRDMIGKHDLEVFPQETARIYYEEELPIFRSGLPLLNKVDPFIDAAGKPGWVSTSKWPLLDQTGQVVGLFGISRDVTEQKLAETKLQLAASVFTHAREGIMITAVDGTIIDVNDAFSRITSYVRDDVMGRNPRLLNSGRQEKAFYAALWRDLVEKGYWYGEVWNRRKNGEVYAVMQTISAVRDGEGNTQQYVALFSDITPLKEHESQLEHIAHYDALTTLPNRVLLADRLHQAMAQAQRRGQRLAVAYLDLDGFKSINDHHGHDAGDLLLIAVASRMKQALREGDTLARLGGDEFVAVLADLSDAAASVPMLTRLLAAAAQPVQADDLVLQVSASLGVTFYPQAEDVDADQLLRQADQAMYQAKLAGKNRYHVFDDEQDRNLRDRHESLERIRRGLSEREFVLYYQPKVNMRTGLVIGAEALIRWQHPQHGLLPPAMFLSVIEDTPLAIELGEWVIDTALTQKALWQQDGLAIPVSVNIGARQLQQTDFVERLQVILAAHPHVRPGDLELEVLETSALEDLAHVSQVINACLAIGVSFALDDFGTGYSSLSYLKRLPVSLLKIDQSFVRDMLEDADDLAILEGVIGLADAFRRQIIAEGVETVEHGEMLLHLGCQQAQGYGIARPMPAQDLPAWSTVWRPDPAWVDLKPVSRDDFALLFANVEHRNWIAAMESRLKDDQADALPHEHPQCRFGQWLHAEGVARHGSEPAFQNIASLHGRMHALAAELLAIKAAAGNDAALARLGELHGLRDALFVELKRFLRRD